MRVCICCVRVATGRMQRWKGLQAAEFSEGLPNYREYGLAVYEVDVGNRRHGYQA